VKASHDCLAGMFKSIEGSVERVMVCTKIEKPKATPAMTEVAVKVINIVAELVSVLAVANNQIGQGWLSQSSFTEKRLYLKSSRETCKQIPRE
jgi:hypothetical protein